MKIFTPLLLPLALLFLTGCLPQNETNAFSKNSSSTSVASESSADFPQRFPKAWSYRLLNNAPLFVPMPAEAMISSNGFESMDYRKSNPNNADQWFSVVVESKRPWNGTLDAYIKQYYGNEPRCSRRKYYSNSTIEIIEHSVPCPAHGPGESIHEYLVLSDGIVYHLRDDITETTASGTLLQDMAIFNIKSAKNE